MPLININDAEMYYELHGHGDPLVLIAGYTCDHTFWNLLLDELAQKFQVLIFDNPGIGQTKDNGSALSLEGMAEAIMMLVNQLGLQKPHILGQSMGGAIAQIIAKKYPKKINKLILLNSTFKFSTRTIKTLESLLNLRKENIPFDLLIETSVPWFFGSDYLAKPSNISTFKDIVRNNPYPQSMQDQERQLRTIPKFDARNWVQEIKATTLVIAAEEDIVCTSAENQQLANHIPNAQLVIIPGGHSSPLEQSEEIMKAISKFL